MEPTDLIEIVAEAWRAGIEGPSRHGKAALVAMADDCGRFALTAVFRLPPGFLPAKLASSPIAATAADCRKCRH